MKVSGYEDLEEFEQEIHLWLERRGIPLQSYENLPIPFKIVLRNQVCTPTRTTSYSQRRELYQKLCLSDIAGRESIDPVDFMPDEKLRKFFKPLTPSEKLPYLYKF